MLQMDPMLGKKFFFHIQEVSYELNNKAAVVVKYPGCLLQCLGASKTQEMQWSKDRWFKCLRAYRVSTAEPRERAEPREPGRDAQGREPQTSVPRQSE